MAKTKLTSEQFEEEINKLNEEIRVSQQELNETLALNIDFANKIERKDNDLLLKDARLKLTREKNAAELEQLQVEVASMRESTTHEVNFHLSEISNLRMSKQRQVELVQENERLKQSIEILEEMTRQDRANHAIAMHEMNKGRRDLRLIMEEKLRKELAGIEISFHKEAFQALHERQKLAMFENAKLKDEVAIQGVGITNLTARLLRQQKFCEKCTKQLHILQLKTKKLRDQLATATQHRNDILRQRETLTKEYEAFTAQTQKLLTRYNQAKTSSEYESISQLLLDKYAMILRTWREEQAQVTLWQQRLAQLTALHLELKPTSESEQNGQYSPSLFPIFTMLEELKAAITATADAQPSQQQPQRYSILPTLMQSLLSSTNNHNQKALQDALQPAFTRDNNLLTTVEVLADKEHKLHHTHILHVEQQLDAEEKRLLQAANGAALENEPEDKETEQQHEAEIHGQDMIAWSVLKILTLWNRTSSALYNHDEYEMQVQHAVRQQQLVLSTPQPSTASLRSPTGSLRSAGSSTLASASPSFYPQQQPVQSLLASHVAKKRDEDGDENDSFASEHTLDNINEGDENEDDDDLSASSSIEGGEEQIEEIFDTFNPDPKSVRPITSSDIYDDGMNRDGFDNLPVELSVSQRQTLIALTPTKPVVNSSITSTKEAETQAQAAEAAAWTEMTITPRTMQQQIDAVAREEEDELAREQEYDELMLVTSSSAPAIATTSAAMRGSASSSWLKPFPKYTTNVFVQELQSTLQPKNPLVVHPNDEIMRYGKDAFEIGPPLVKHMKLSSSTSSLSQQQGRPLSASGKLLSPLVLQQSSRAGNSKQEAFGLASNHDFSSSSISAYQPLTAKKSNDPLLQKQSLNKLTSSVQVSNKVLRRLPKSLSTPLLERQTKKASGSSLKKSKAGRSEALLEPLD